MRKGLIIGAGAVLLVVTGLYLSEDIGRTDGFPDRSFDPLAWRMGDRRERGAMATDLERSALLIGRTKGEVLDLLGDPTASDTNGLSMAYVVDLGLRTGPWGLGGPWLFQTTVRFDSLSGTVNAVRTSD